MQAWDLMVHKLRLNTYWEDYYRFGFYRPDLTWPEKSLYIGDESSLYWPWEGNPLAFDRFFIRKTLHKAVLDYEGLPTSRILLKAGRMYPINSSDKFEKELRKIDRPFVVKIDGGGSGAWNSVFTPENDRYRSGDELWTAEEIWRQYEPVLGPGFLVEEKVDNHPVLAEIHPASLNTLRLNMVKTLDGKWHHLRPCLKIGRGGSHVDNVSSGGVISALDEKGTILATYSEDGERFDVHPDTGVSIRGRTVPYFREALELSMRASQTFGFMGTIGWDVAVTPDGPTIIEGNARWWAEFLQDVLGPLLTPEIAAGLVPRRWWTPWNRTHMFPGYRQYRHGNWWAKLVAGQRRRAAARRTSLKSEHSL